MTGTAQWNLRLKTADGSTIQLKGAMDNDRSIALFKEVYEALKAHERSSNVVHSIRAAPGQSLLPIGGGEG